MRQKTNETKEQKRTSVENLTGYYISFKNLLCLLLTYLIESWISPGCSYEFNVVFMQREKSQHLFATTYEVHTFKNNNKKIIKRQFCLLFSFLYLFICSCKFVIIETRTYDIAVDEKVMSCKAYIRGRSKSATDIL